MTEAALPKNETERLKALRALRILDTPIEERFERITRIVCRSLNVPISAISLVDEERQWFKSIQGITANETPRSVAFCAHAILQNEPLIIEDATKDDRFCKNPLVTDAPIIRFYAGFPISISKDVRIGTLCAIDNKPREITLEQLEIMDDLRKMVESELKTVALSSAHIQLISELAQAERAALIDPLTQLWNRRGGEQLLQREWLLAKLHGHQIALVMLDIDHFKTVNDTYGHSLGDTAIRQVAKVMISVLRASDAICRWGGDEFLCILPNCQASNVFQILERARNAIENCPIVTPSGDISFTLSIGAFVTHPSDNAQIEGCIKQADAAMYEAKMNGRNQIVVKQSSINRSETEVCAE
ncbi:MAG: sensor domain-containing diguanylate cyclase [Anaerolineae bacterium]|nr:sensor domain-containing diguanylate cyclase [Gloeobacterales cyanobacterium ES-bin-313]